MSKWVEGPFIPVWFCAPCVLSWLPSGILAACILPCDSLYEIHEAFRDGGSGRGWGLGWSSARPFRGELAKARPRRRSRKASGKPSHFASKSGRSTACLSRSRPGRSRSSSDAFAPRPKRAPGRPAFARLGWQVARRRGSHIILVQEGEVATLPVPDHREVARGTLRTLMRAAGSRLKSSFASFDDRWVPVLVPLVPFRG